MSWSSPVPESLVVSAISNVNTYCISRDASYSSLVSGFEGLNHPETI